jgi:homoserine kinase
MKHPFKTSDSIARFNAERVACLAVALCAGKTPEQAAAAIASRVIESLRAKLPTEAARREIAR